MKNTLKIICAACFHIYCIGAYSQQTNYAGVWEGEYTSDGITNEIELNVAFSKTRDFGTSKSDQYVGIAHLKQTKNENITYATPGDKLFGKLAKKPKADIFTRFWTDADAATNTHYLHYNEAVLLSGDEQLWCLKDVKFIYSEDNTGKYLTGTVNNCSKGSLKLKRSIDAVAEKESNEIREVLKNIQQGIIYSSFTFISAEGGDVLKPSQAGAITLKITNNSPYNIRDGYCYLNIDNKGSEKVSLSYGGVSSYGSIGIPINIPKGKSSTVQAYTKTGFETPLDSVVFTASLDPLDGLIENATLRTASEGFFKNKQFILPSANDARAVALEFGFGKPSFDELKSKALLNQLAASGDKKALMWQSLLIYTGQNGFSKNEEYAIYKAKKGEVFDYLFEKAKESDAEAIYLLSYAYAMGLSHSGIVINTDYFLKTASDNNYLPAMYDQALRNIASKNYMAAKDLLDKCFTKGFKKAGFYLAQLFETGSISNPKKDTAFRLYTILSKMGSVDAMLHVAEILDAGKSVKKDAAQALLLAQKAANMQSTTAMVFAANLIIQQNAINKEKSLADAIAWLTKAAASNDREAMFVMGTLYFNSKTKDSADDKKVAATWIKKAAALGQPQAMNILGMMYGVGEVVEKDMASSRYWLNQAKAKGVGTGYKKDEIATSPLLTFLQGVASYQPTIYTVVSDRYGNELSRSWADDGVIDYGIAGLWNVFKESQRHKQAIINDVKEMKSDSVSVTYGGVMTSAFNIPHLKKGDVIDIEINGQVNFGIYAGTAGPEGLNKPSLQGFSVIPHYNHGAVLSISNTNQVVWVGNGFTDYTFPTDGPIIVFVNDKQYENNAGYFDVKMVVYKK